MSYKKDYEFGKDKEDKILTYLNNYFKRNIIKSEERYCTYDFYDAKYKYELKSRRCSVNTYDTTMIPVMKCKKRTYLLFLFTDGLYYIKYKEHKFKDFEIKNFVKFREDKKDVKKEYYYIPTDKLKKIDYVDVSVNIDNEDFKIYF